MAEHEIRASDALILTDYRVEPGALVAPFTDDERSAIKRYVYLTKELARCKYFTEEERSFSVTMDRGVTTSWEQVLPDAGATRDMLGLLRQLFGDKERGSFAAVSSILVSHSNTQTIEGRRLLSAIDRFQYLRQGVLDSWDVRPNGKENAPGEPLTVFLDWMYGEFLHSDADKAARIASLDTEFRLYEWQFHWVAERLAALYTTFAVTVESALEQAASSISLTWR